MESEGLNLNPTLAMKSSHFPFSALALQPDILKDMKSLIALQLILELSRLI